MGKYNAEMHELPPITGLWWCLWLVRRCNNTAIHVWRTEAATFTGVNYSVVSCCHRMCDWKGFKVLYTYRARCECHSVEKRSFKIQEKYRGTWADDCRSCLRCCLKTWPVPMTVTFNGGLDEDYWGHLSVIKGYFYQENGTIHVPVLFSSFSTVLNKCFIIF